METIANQIAPKISTVYRKLSIVWSFAQLRCEAMTEKNVSRLNFKHCNDGSNQSLDS